MGVNVASALYPQLLYSSLCGEGIQSDQMPSVADGWEAATLIPRRTDNWSLTAAYKLHGRRGGEGREGVWRVRKRERDQRGREVNKRAWKGFGTSSVNKGIA